MRISMTLAVVSFVLVPIALSHKSCFRNANIMKSIQYQLKLVEDDDCTCDSSQKANTDVTKVGFLATSSNNLENLASDAIVVFDTVTTNVGGGYDPSTGIFTAPVGGLYFFSWTTVIANQKYFFTYIDLNGKVIARNHGDGRIGPTANISSSQSVVVQIKKDDKVSIKVHTGYTGQFMYGEKWSTFIGYSI